MNWATRISVFRILLAPMFVTALVYTSPEKAYLHLIAIALFSLACLTDALDGYLARKHDQVTDFGTYIDPMADKALLLSGFLSLSFMTHLPDAMRIPAWVTISVVTRDIVIVIGSTIIFFTTGRLKAKPLFIGKLTTVFQMAALFLALLRAPEPLRMGIFWVVVILTVASGIQYIRLGGKIVQAS